MKLLVPYNECGDHACIMDWFIVKYLFLPSRSGLIWQVEKAKRRWKTLNSSTIELLEQAYQRKELDIRQKDLAVRAYTVLE